MPVAKYQLKNGRVVEHHVESEQQKQILESLYPIKEEKGSRKGKTPEPEKAPENPDKE